MPESNLNPNTDPQGTGTDPEVFSREYVQTLRGENKGLRLDLKAVKSEKVDLENKFKKLIGLKEDEILDDSKVNTYLESRKVELENAKKELEDFKASIESEKKETKFKSAIGSLVDKGWDAKLLERLVDRSALTMDEEGVPTNLLEVAEGLAKEFPALKVGDGANNGGANPAGIGGNLPNEWDEYDTALKAGNMALAVAIKNRIFEKKK